MNNTVMKRFALRVVRNAAGVALLAGFAAGFAAEKLPAPVISPGDTIFIGDLLFQFHISDEHFVYFTMDGSIPTSESSKAGPNVFYKTDSTVTIKALNIAAYYDTLHENSELVSVTYSRKCTKPSIRVYYRSLDTGYIKVQESVYPATVYYTVDGSDPDTNSTVYTDSLIVTEPTHFRAIRVMPGMLPSDPAELHFSLPGSSIHLYPSYVRKYKNRENEMYSISGRLLPGRLGNCRRILVSNRTIIIDLRNHGFFR